MIFSFLDYRAYLEEQFQIHKESNPRFSYREFSKLCNSTIPSFLQLISARKLNLTQQAIQDTAKGLKLNKKESEYFNYIVQYDQAKTFQEKEKAYQQALKLKTLSKAQKVEHKHYQYYSKWYHSALRALLGYIPFNPVTDKLSTLSKKLSFPVSAQETKKSLALLESMGFIKINKNSQYEQTSPHVSTGEKPKSIHITKHQIETLELASKARIQEDPRNIEYSTLTCNISEKGFLEVKNKLIQTRKEIIEMVHRDTKEDRVYQLNMQLFPLSKISQKEV